MENASKALIMAGGMLIGILILSLGLYMFVTFSDRADKVYDKVKEDQIAQFNSNFIYDEDRELTIYDIVNVAKRAKENNGELEESDFGYITILLENRNISEKNFKDEDYEKLLEDDRETITSPGMKLPGYKCASKEYNESGTIKKVRFVRC